MRANRTLEIGTGLFVLLGFAALLFLTTQLPARGLKFGAAKTGYHVTAAFDNVGETDGLRDLAHLVIDLGMRGAAEDIHRAGGRTKAINSRAKAGDDRSHEREFARREHRTAWRSVRRK